MSASIGLLMRPASCASAKTAGLQAPGRLLRVDQPCIVSAPGGKKPFDISFSVIGPIPPSFSIMSRTFHIGVFGGNRVRSFLGMSVLRQLHGLEVGGLD